MVVSKVQIFQRVDALVWVLPPIDDFHVFRNVCWRASAYIYPSSLLQTCRKELTSRSELREGKQFSRSVAKL